MNLRVLDLNFNPLVNIETYESVIWADRFSKQGDFEISVAADTEVTTIFPVDYYLSTSLSEHFMIIETHSIETDPEEGTTILITGRSLESILKRRIVWGQIVLNGNFQDAILMLLNNNIINPTDPDRKINNFIFSPSTDPEITSLTIDAQFTGKDLYEIISTVCSERQIGFKIIVNDNGEFVFSLYAGKDRSYAQTVNPYVIFSPDFDNLAQSRYLHSKEPFKNVTLVGGEGEGSDRKYKSVGSGSGLSRREFFTDAKDISSKTDSGVLTDTEYYGLLEQRGNEKLAETIELSHFDGQMENQAQFQLFEDFFMGDVVQIANEYGHEARSRVSEIIISDDINGLSIYPTCEKIT